MFNLTVHEDLLPEGVTVDDVTMAITVEEVPPTREDIAGELDRAKLLNEAYEVVLGELRAMILDGDIDTLKRTILRLESDGAEDAA